MRKSTHLEVENWIQTEVFRLNLRPFLLNATLAIAHLWEGGGNPVVKMNTNSEQFEKDRFI